MRHSCSGDLESVLALANISSPSCTVCTFESWCISLHVELILHGNQQFLHLSPTETKALLAIQIASFQIMIQNNQSLLGLL